VVGDSDSGGPQEKTDGRRSIMSSSSINRGKQENDTARNESDNKKANLFGKNKHALDQCTPRNKANCLSVKSRSVQVRCRNNSWIFVGMRKKSFVAMGSKKGKEKGLSTKTSRSV